MEAFVDQFVCQFGTPMQLHFDQGTNFLTTILPILFLYLNTVTVTAGTFEP
jgi:hypothetical protein